MCIASHTCFQEYVIQTCISPLEYKYNSPTLLKHSSHCSINQLYKTFPYLKKICQNNHIRKVESVGLRQANISDWAFSIRSNFGNVRLHSVFLFPPTCECASYRLYFSQVVASVCLAQSSRLHATPTDRRQAGFQLLCRSFLYGDANNDKLSCNRMSEVIVVCNITFWFKDI